MEPKILHIITDSDFQEFVASLDEGRYFGIYKDGKVWSAAVIGGQVRAVRSDGDPGGSGEVIEYPSSDYILRSIPVPFMIFKHDETKGDDE